MGLRCQKSAEAILSYGFFQAGEGLNIERFLKPERLERIAMKANNFMKDESCPFLIPLNSSFLDISLGEFIIIP